MRLILTMITAFLVFGAAPLAAETVEGVLVDKQCSANLVKKGYEAAEEHTKECALLPNCKSSGFGVVTEDGKFLKFDAAGDEKAIEALEATDQEDDLIVEVEGKVEGNTIKVETVTLI